MQTINPITRCKRIEDGRSTKVSPRNKGEKGGLARKVRFLGSEKNTTHVKFFKQLVGAARPFTVTILVAEYIEAIRGHVFSRLRSGCWQVAILFGHYIDVALRLLWDTGSHLNLKRHFLCCSLSHQCDMSILFVICKLHGEVYVRSLIDRCNDLYFNGFGQFMFVCG